MIHLNRLFAIKGDVFTFSYDCAITNVIKVAKRGLGPYLIIFFFSYQLRVNVCA